MTPKQLAKLVVQYHETKADKPDPNCSLCGGSGIDVWYHPHNGNEEKSPCKCLYRTMNELKERIKYQVSVGDENILKICKHYLKNN